MKLSILVETYSSSKWKDHYNRIDRLRKKIDSLLGPVLDTFHREITPAHDQWLDMLTTADTLLDKAKRIDPSYAEANRTIQAADRIIGIVMQRRREAAEREIEARQDQKRQMHQGV